MMKKYCTSCGAAIPEQALFCGACGQKQPAFEKKSTLIKDKPSSRRKKTIYIISAILLLVIATSCAAYYFYSCWQGKKTAPQSANSSVTTSPSTGNLLAPVKQGGKYGYINENGRVIIDFQFDEAGYFAEGLAPVIMNGRAGYIDGTGQWKLELSKALWQGDRRGEVHFYEVKPFHEGIALVSLHDDGSVSNGIRGYVGKDGSWEVKPQHNMGVRGLWGNKCSSGLIAWTDLDEGPKDIHSPMVANFHVYVDKHGVRAFSTGFDIVTDFSENMAFIQKDGYTFCIDRNGNIAFGLKWESPSPSADFMHGEFSEGLSPARGYEMVYEDKNLMPPTAKGETGRWGEKRYAYGDERCYGYINTSGRFVIVPKFSSAGAFHEGLAVVLLPNSPNRGYINKNGDVAIPCNFERANDFSEGLAAVQVKNKWGYIDKTGKIVVDCKYDAAGEFKKTNHD